MSQTSDYTFDMFDLRKIVLATVAENVRNDDLVAAKHDAARLIRNQADGDASDRQQAAKAFKTSFDRARETIEEGGDYDLDIDTFPSDGILHDHDAEIDPTTDIEGDVVEVLTSIKTEGWGQPEKNIYPVVEHQPSGYRVCTCPAQKYYIVCPHTLARIIERNWQAAPVPA